MRAVGLVSRLLLPNHECNRQDGGVEAEWPPLRCPGQGEEPLSGAGDPPGARDWSIILVTVPCEGPWGQGSWQVSVPAGRP